ncbi:hypothetical protein ACWCV9_20770 [Streptomyces sp. NPDC001606]
MADEQYRWLNRETAERLLRGEPLEAVDPRARDQAERLSEALGALSARTAGGTAELPGEQAALAAFRTARDTAAAEPAATAGASGRRFRAFGNGSDAGLVRIGFPGRTGISGRPRWGRPVRLALAAAVAASALGGVAVAAGSGVLPVPFGHREPGPAASADGRPLTSPSPTGQGPGTANGSAPADRGATSGEAAAPDETRPSAGAAGRWSGAGSACRDLRDGKDLDTGRKRALEKLAGGSNRVKSYCKVVLGSGEGGSGGSGDAGGWGGSGDAGGWGGSGAASGGKGGSGQGQDQGAKGEGKSNGNGQGQGKDKGKGEQDGGGQGEGDSHPGHGGTGTHPGHGTGHPGHGGSGTHPGHSSGHPGHGSAKGNGPAAGSGGTAGGTGKGSHPKSTTGATGAGQPKAAATPSSPAPHPS